MKRCCRPSLVGKPVFNAVLCLFVGVLLWSCPFFIAHAFFSEDFEDFNYGVLNGQGGWADGNNEFYITDGYVNSGTHGVTIFSGGWGRATAIYSASSTDGTNIIYFQFSSTTDGDLFKISEQGIWPQWNFKLSKTGGVYDAWIQDALGSYSINIGSDLSPSTWYEYSLDFSCTDSRWRGKIDDGAYSDWIVTDCHDLGATERLEISILRPSIQMAFDDIGIAPPVCGLGNCTFCEIYDTCVDAGCFWYHADWTLTPNEWCVEPPAEPSPEECGPFYKCQYCDQTGCEAQTGFCDWKDIGFGDKCYMTEPEIPPEQGNWEAPELDECGELSGVELWLCNIKNFIAGIFMPTEAKVNEFYSTMGNFKERFPFNYSRALATFFGDIQTSFDTEKAVPVKILGESGNVSFQFWSASTTIGGTSETFANVVKDVSTFIIFLVLAVWIISLIKRFL